MNFKDYLNDTINEKSYSSRDIWDWMRTYRIPLSPKFFEEVFYADKKEQICFVSRQPHRIKSLYKRQNSKNQISAFTDYKDASIFWGAAGLNWHGDYKNNESLVAVLKGKVTIKGTSDLWTSYDAGGRRWINVSTNIRHDTEFSKILQKIQSDIKKNYLSGLKDIEFETLRWVSKNGGLIWNNTNDKTPQRGRDYQKAIKLYFDCAYDAIKKYKKELLVVGKKGLAKEAKYNEVLCYDYKVEKVFVLSDDRYDTMFTYDWMIDALKEYEYVDKFKLDAELKKIKAKNDI